MIKVIQRPSIILRDLVIDYEGDTNDDDIKYYVEQIGKYPYLQIGDTVIEINNMIQTILYNNQFLPKIEVQFRDPTNRLFDVLFPVDNEILSLFIQSNSEILMPIRMDFKILDFNIIKNKENEKNDLIYSIVGILNVNNLYFNSFSSYPNTSFEVLKKISTDSELGFATNIDNTNDGMIWINTGNTNLKFIQNVVSHSYLNDSTFMYAYIDFYYNLNYVDIESALNEDISDQTGILFSSNLTTNLNNDSEETEMDLILTNHPDKLNSNNYINKFNIINSSTRVNLDIGYKSILIYNDKNDNVIYKLLMDTITTTGKNNDQVVLKGKVGEISELMENSIDYMNLGKIDTDNVHSNYLYAKQQNIKNLNALQKIKVKVVINLMNFNLYRFQKIQLKFYKMDDISITDDKPIKPTPEKVENYNGENYDENRINKRLSGEWLITAINYTFNKISGFSQEVTLVKRELGFNDDDFNN